MSRILFFLSGSIAAFKACQVISKLVQDGHEVQTVATESALKFVGSATLEGLTGKPVLRDLWEEGRAMDHIHFTRWADFAVLCPASANSIAKLSHGFGDDLLSAMALAWPKTKKFHVFPAMNVNMLSNEATQSNLTVLSSRGFTVHETQSGNLACGEAGAGRLLEPEAILERLLPKAKGKILITAGATREPIDGIRFISNVSTGQTGATLANLLSARGWEITYLHGIGAHVPSTAHTNIVYRDFADLNECLRSKLARENFSAVIHSAAVSDYSVARVNGQAPEAASKLSSSADLSLDLKRNFKILPRLKEYSLNKQAIVIGFKLTLNSARENTLQIARELLRENVDAVVANDWSQVDRDRSRHPGDLVAADKIFPFADLTELVERLDLFIEEKTHGSLS